MKKSAAILLVFILFFNLFGYRFVINSLQQKADHKLETVIDNKEYNEDELMEIRLSLNMPYQERHTGFERHYGEITVDGKMYTYVKMKIEGNILILKCIANHNRQQLNNTANNIVKANSGQDTENTGKKNNTFNNKVFSSDYDDSYQLVDLQIKVTAIKLFKIDYADALRDVLIKIPYQPPQCWS